jgi:hypothetical protein
MNKSNLLKIMRTFSPKEIKEFGDFVQSPFFNKNESTIKLYGYIRKEYPDFNSDNLDKEVVYRNLFPGTEYNDGFMRTIIFNLSTLAEEFLTYVNFKNDKARYGIMKLQELNSRKLDKLLLKHLAAVEAEVSGIEDKNSDYLYYKYLIEQIIYSYRNWSRFKSKNLKDYDDSGILKEIHYLMSYSLGKALANYRFLVTKAETEHIDVRFEMLDEIIKFLTSRENKYILEPVVKLHLFEILLMREKSDKYFTILKEMLFNKGLKITRDERFSLHNILQVYCNHKIFTGHTKFRKERFELYKAALKNKFYSGSEDIYFDDLLFANIALIALHEKETDWTKKFIDEYKGQLSPENRNITFNYCLARYYHEKGEHEKGLVLLNGIKSIKHVQFKLVIRNLTLMFYYELSMFEAADSHCDSYRHFLKKNASVFAKARLERQSNFIKMYCKLTKLKEKPDKKSIEELSHEIRKQTNLIEKDWLAVKIKDLSL